MIDLSSYLAAVEKGAANIYHDVLATGTTVTDWEASHPTVAPFIAQAVTFAEGLITRVTGIPVGTIEVAGADIIAALKGIVAGDATVPSLPGTTTTTTTATSVIGTIEQAALSAAVTAGDALIADAAKAAAPAGP